MTAAIFIPSQSSCAKIANPKARCCYPIFRMQVASTAIKPSRIEKESRNCIWRRLHLRDLRLAYAQMNKDRKVVIETFTKFMGMHRQERPGGTTAVSKLILRSRTLMKHTIACFLMSQL